MRSKKIQSVSSIEKKNEVTQTIVLKSDTEISGKRYKAGTEIEVTDEIKKLLKPFGYFKS